MTTIARGSLSALLSGISAQRLRELYAQEPPKSAPWVFVAAADGLPLAQLCYGCMLLGGTGVPKDEIAALGWFRRAAAQGDVEAINMVGRCFDEGWGMAPDPAAAAVWYQRAAECGHAWARYNLGHLFLDGRGVARDHARAFALYHAAASQGHERAMNLLGRCHENGWGTPRDQAAAAAWYRRSAEGGYFRGQYNWATLLLASGRVDEAAKWFERAAMTGSPQIRKAVIDRFSRPGIADALQRLAARLQDPVRI